MENASKALIIAGAILISILIVGLGVIIYNNVSGIAKGGTLDEVEISSHNSPFESYFGNTVSGANVKALFTKITSNNNAAGANDEIIGNKIYTIDASNQPVTAANIKTGRTYTVRLADGEQYSDVENDNATYWANGYIKTIVIQVNQNKPGTTTPPAGGGGGE